MKTTFALLVLLTSTISVDAQSIRASTMANGGGKVTASSGETMHSVIGDQTAVGVSEVSFASAQIRIHLHNASIR